MGTGDVQENSRSPLPSGEQAGPTVMSPAAKRSRSEHVKNSYCHTKMKTC